MSYRNDRIQLTISDKNRSGAKSVIVNIFPDKCPFCDKGIKPLYCYGILIDSEVSFKDVLLAVFQCTIRECSLLFVGIYNQWEHQSSDFRLQKSFQLSQMVEYSEFPEVITRVSPRFQKIYNQANIAEENGLDEIAGVGYGKSLEFLIKDYLLRIDTL